MLLYQTPGRRLPRITGRVVNTVVTRGWVGAPNERAPFRIHDAVVGFVSIHVCHGLEISPLRIKNYRVLIVIGLTASYLEFISSTTPCQITT